MNPPHAGPSPEERYELALRACAHRSADNAPPCRECVIRALASAEADGARKAGHVDLDTTIGGPRAARGPLVPPDRG